MRFLFIVGICLAGRLCSYSQGHWYPEGNAHLFNSTDTTVAAFYNDTTNNRLYVGGRFDHIGGVPANHIAYWDGTSWNAMGSGIDTNGLVGVGAICPYNGDIYVTGTFRSFNDVIYNNVARWDGSSWVPLAGGLHGTSIPTVCDMCVYNGLLYIVGRFDSAGTVPAGGVAAWDGNAWHSLGDSDVSLYWPQTCIVHDSTLLMGGVFSTVDTGNGSLSAPRVVGWNAFSNQWVTFGNIGGPVNDLVEFQGEVYAGGQFQNTNGNNIAKWDGSNWTPLGSGFDNYVRTLCVYEDSLVAGGAFRHSGSLTVNYIAMWDGASWSDLDSGFSTSAWFWPEVLSCIQFEDRIYAGGFFSYASNTKCAKLAVWPHSPLAVSQQPDLNSAFTVWPNPFGTTLTVEYNLTNTSPVEICLFDALGNLIAIPFSAKNSAPGTHSITINAEALGLAQGIYFLRINSAENCAMQKVIFQGPE
jgi:hypothetical protein